MSRGLFGSLAAGLPGGAGVRADYFQAAGGGIEIDLGNPEHVAYLRGQMTAAGVSVTEAGALKIATAWRCLHILAGAIGNTPLDLMEQVSERDRRPAVGHQVRRLLKTRPNHWQTPQDFKRMLGAHVVQRGNGYGLKLKSGGRISQIWPLHPDRTECVQRDDMSLAYLYTRKDGSRVPLTQDDVLHVRGLSLDGITGMGVLSWARETLGSAIQGQKAGARMWRQGLIAPGALRTPNRLSDEAFARLEKAQEQRSGADNAHKWMILEEGLDIAQLTFSAVDMQFLDSRKFDRSDVCAFYGVPEFLAGIGDKDSNWGTGLEQKTTAFRTFTLEDYFVAFEQAGNRDLLSEADAERYYLLFNRSAYARSDLKARWEAYTRALQWGVYSPNRVLELEDENPRPGGDVYYDPPNTAGGAGAADPGAPSNDPPQR